MAFSSSNQIREGLPAAPSFPNLRATSPQQPRILLDLPLLSLSTNISLNNFSSNSWGIRPDNPKEELDVVERLYKEVPVLVPVYRNCYIPSTTNAVGNPVFPRGWISSGRGLRSLRS